MYEIVCMVTMVALTGLAFKPCASLIQLGIRAQSPCQSSNIRKHSNFITWTHAQNAFSELQSPQWKIPSAPSSFTEDGGDGSFAKISAIVDMGL